MLFQPVTLNIKFLNIENESETPIILSKLTMVFF